MLGTSAGVFSLFLAAAALVGEVGLAVGGGVKGAEEGPADASSAVIRLLRKRSMGVLGVCRDAAPLCMHRQHQLSVCRVKCMLLASCRRARVNRDNA